MNPNQAFRTGTFAAMFFALAAGLSAQTTPARKPAMAVAHKPTAPTAAEPQPEITRQYCIGCHSEKGKAGGLSLVSFDAAHADQNADVAEKIIHKLRLGMMPPPGVRRPEGGVLTQFASALETKIDAASTLRPNPGRRPFQRLNRAEYERSVHDLLDLDVDVNAFLPPDTLSAGYDNIADVQTFSPTLMEGYLRAAGRISTLAGRRPHPSPPEATLQVPPPPSHMKHNHRTPPG